MGADYIEPDLVTTADGVLVARHEPEIGGDHRRRRRTRSSPTGGPPRRSTGRRVHRLVRRGLHPRRAARRCGRGSGSRRVRPREHALRRALRGADVRRDPRAAGAAVRASCGREIGVYPETKHPTYFAALGLPLEPALVDALRGAGLNRPDAPVFVQSFETANLRALRARCGPAGAAGRRAGAPADLVAAGDPAPTPTSSRPTGWPRSRRTPTPSGRHKNQVIPRDAAGTLARARPRWSPTRTRLGLLVHAYTFRNENRVPARGPAPRQGDADDDGDAFAEYVAFFAAGRRRGVHRPPGHRRGRPRRPVALDRRRIPTAQTMRSSS